MKKSHKFLVLLSIIIVSTFFIKATQQTKDQVTKSKEIVGTSPRSVGDYYEIRALKMPSNLDFAGERVPLEDADVYERMDRELHINTYWQSNTLFYFKRAHKYFPLIEQILAENGVPNDFKYLAVIESGLMNATSSAGAKGFWQIMKTTGREYGLEINRNVDERYNLIKSTQVACKYLKKQYKKFGNWTLAAAAYNGGRAGMIRRLDKQKATSYYDLLLGQETSRYVLRIIAAKEILSQPLKYGFVFDQEDLYTAKPTRTISVDKAIPNIANFAKENNMSYKQFKALNPWLRENFLNNASRKKYDIVLPM
ncbi:MAG: lytic transglycosylase domain-containing protein [Flavobacteriaceae bacterium]